MQHDLIKLMKTAREISGRDAATVYVGLSDKESRVTRERDEVEDMPTQLIFQPHGK